MRARRLRDGSSGAGRAEAQAGSGDHQARSPLCLASFPFVSGQHRAAGCGRSLPRSTLVWSPRSRPPRRACSRRWWSCLTATRRRPSACGLWVAASGSGCWSVIRRTAGRMRTRRSLTTGRRRWHHRRPLRLRGRHHRHHRHHRRRPRHSSPRRHHHHGLCLLALQAVTAPWPSVQPKWSGSQRLAPPPAVPSNGSSPRSRRLEPQRSRRLPSGK